MNDNTPEKTTANRSLAHAQPYVPETVSLLDPRAEGGIAVHDSTKGFRMWAATISAGWKENDSPRVVRDGMIRLHEDTGPAPGIAAALKAHGGKALTITMLSDSIADCMKQLLTAYGSTRVYGDNNGLTIMGVRDGKMVHDVILPGDPKFAPTLKLCKATTFIPFALAEWGDGDDPEPKMQFPDGLLPYRLRFGSVNSARVFVDQLQAIKRLTNGHLKGIPLLLSISYQSKTYFDEKEQKIKRTTVPIWNPVLKHPKGLTLGTAMIQRVMLAGMADAQMLALPAPMDMTDPEVVEAIIESEEKIDREVHADPTTGEVIEGQFTETNPDLRTITTQEVPRRRVDDFFRAGQSTPFVRDSQRPNMVRRMAIASGVELGEPSLALLAEKATADEWEIAMETFCKAVAAYHGTEEVKPAKAVVSAADPYADATPVTGTKPAEKPTETPTAAAVVVAPVEDPKPKPAQAKKRETAAKVEETTPAPAAPTEEVKPTPAAVLPTVNNYVLLERAPTPAEAEWAVEYVAEHLTEDQFAKLVEFAGGINPAFVVLQARKNKVTDFGGFMRLIDHEWKEETN